MVWLMITSIFLMILILILISPISTQIQATITETEQFFAVKVFFYGICLYTKKKKITLGNQDNIWVLLENIKTQGINQIKLNKIDVQDLWRDILQVLDKVKVQQFSWKTRIGREKAMWAGLYTGILWMIKGFVIHLIAKQTQLKRQPVTEVMPYFQQQYFHSEFSCMVSMRTGQAIHILWSMLTKK